MATKKAKKATKRFVRSKGGALIGWTIAATTDPDKFIAVKANSLTCIYRKGTTEPRLFTKRHTAVKALRDWWTRYRTTVADLRSGSSDRAWNGKPM